MKILSFGVAAFGLLALALGLKADDMWEVGLGVSALVCAGTTYLSGAISSYLRIFVAIFSVETIVFGIAVVINKAGLWPAGARLVAATAVPAAPSVATRATSPGMRAAR